jgi:hypothetical protein
VPGAFTRLGAIRVHPGFFRVHLRFFFSVWFLDVLSFCRSALPSFSRPEDENQQLKKRRRPRTLRGRPRRRRTTRKVAAPGETLILLLKKPLGPMLASRAAVVSE